MIWLLDSADHYTTIADATAKWSPGYLAGTVSVDPTAGRNGGGAIQLNGGVAHKDVSNFGPHVVIGVAVKPLPGTVDLTIACTNHAEFQYRADGSVEAFSAGGTGDLHSVGRTASDLIDPTVYTYLECWLQIDDAAGAMHVQINGTPALDVTGINTRHPSLQPYLYWLELRGACWFDDVYLLNGDPSGPTTFYGDCRIDCAYPAADGFWTQGTPSAGAARWPLVDERPPEVAPNGDTDFVDLPAPGQLLTTTPTPAGNRTVYAVQLCLSARTTDGGVGSIAPVIRSGGSDFAAPGVALTQTFAYVRQAYGTHPSGVPWSAAGFTASEIGALRPSVAGTPAAAVRVSQIVAELLSSSTLPPEPPPLPLSTAIDAALVQRLSGDPALMALMPDGVVFDLAPANSTQFVLLSLVSADDRATFAMRAIEDLVYIVKAVCLGASGVNAGKAADRIDALLEDQPLAVAGYGWMTTHREQRIRNLERDDVDAAIQWQHRGGYYRVMMATAGTPAQRGRP